MAYITGPLFFGAVDEFNHRMAEMPQYDHIILSMRGMPSVDVSGAQAMLELCESLKSQGKTVACCGMTEAVRSYFDRAGITELLGEESYFWSADQAILDLPGRGDRGIKDIEKHFPPAAGSAFCCTWAAKDFICAGHPRVRSCRAIPAGQPDEAPSGRAKRRRSARRR